MKYLALLIIKMYWFLIPASKRRKCIFRKSCSKHVYDMILNKGIILGLKAFKFRYLNCRQGVEVFKNPLTNELQFLLPNNSIVEEEEIAERLIKTKNLTS